MTNSKIESAGQEFLRHAVATLAYRGGKAIREAPEDFASFRIGPETRSPAEILAHIGDLLYWALSQAEGHEVWRDAGPRSWEDEIERFYDGLARLDARLASGEPCGCPEEKMLQGPIADALTHVGQIAMLRGLAGFPVRAENYYRADIEVGRVGVEQTAPQREFD